MKQVSFEELTAGAMRQLDAGAFLLSGGENPNPMTIGWCQWGIVWGKPICTVFVRKSRFSYETMQAGTFTVSVPAPNTMKKELSFCGSKSGRDVNKAEALGLSYTALGEGLVPGIAGCKLHFACKTVFHVDFDAEKMQKDMDGNIRKRYYGANQTFVNGDPHVVFYGEIVGAWEE